MANPISDYLLWLAPLAISFYTLSYARWLLREKNRCGAAGVAVLALAAALYPGIVLFFITK